MTTSRRSFLKAFGLGAAAVVATKVLPSGLLVPDEEEPKVRRYFDMGRGLKREKGFRPLAGHPGFFVDENGNVLAMRDFRESDKYDTITIPASREDSVRFVSEGWKSTPNEASARKPHVVRWSIETDNGAVYLSDA